jgi:hydrogenase maturation protein HypF
VVPGDGGVDAIDPEPLLREVVRELRAPPSPALAARLAAGFHVALADAFSRAARDAARREGIADVVLSGGVFQNRLLLELTEARLEGAGLRVHVPALVPANDGGIALGQAAVAAWRRRAGG